MKHAWIYVQNGTSRPEIVEAISEGVVCRSPIYPMHSDYAIILTPSKQVGITEEERKGACLKARQIVGEKYDHRFEFDIEAELKFYDGQRIDEARDHLQVGKEWIRRFDHAFSCTEVVSYCWWHRKEDLGVRRTDYPRYPKRYRKCSGAILVRRGCARGSRLAHMVIRAHNARSAESHARPPSPWRLRCVTSP